jgi:dTDP-4-dehydrorhamnose 3,5-epimerase
MRIEHLAIADVRLLTPAIFKDHRGHFLEAYNAERLARQAGIDVVFVQDNQSLSVETGVVRGLHFQKPPAAQGKLVRVLRGSIFDVAVDIRSGSPTFGRHVGVTLSAENCAQLWVPPGFAHGFATLEPYTEVFYKVTDYYAPEHDCGLAWDDPELAIAWPVARSAARLSDRDKTHPRLRDIPAYFPQNT